MIAEIYHKNTSYLEDELTGNFFGTMRYMPFDRGLRRIFCNYVVSDDAQVKDIILNACDEEFEIEFWKRSDNGLVEIDIYIPLSNAGIGIEVKYQSGLSGDNQLEKEARFLSEECCKGKDKILLFIAKDEDAKEIYEQNKDKEIFTEVHLAYISWQDILLGLDEIIVTSSYEKKMVEDLKQLLIEKGFIAFDGFECELPVVKEELFYEFG